MGYPYGKTYLEQIQANEEECHLIRQVYFALERKYIKEHTEYSDESELALSERFALLGETFELASPTIREIADEYHFMWDVVEALLAHKEEEKKK